MNQLYAATSSAVFKWNPLTSDWDAETLPNQGSVQILDLWVSGDGNEVWVALNASFVLRKRGTTWESIPLPVASTFLAYRIFGFDSAGRDLWITGSHQSQAFQGTIAYHFERQP